jgi:hypothetical protein
MQHFESYEASGEYKKHDYLDQFKEVATVCLLCRGVFGRKVLFLQFSFEKKVLFLESDSVILSISSVNVAPFGRGRSREGARNV